MKETTLKSTPETFAEKWNRWGELLLDGDIQKASGILAWIMERNGWHASDELRKFLTNRVTILDAGCGNGRITRVLNGHASPNSRISAWDINPTVAARNLGGFAQISVQKVDLSSHSLPSEQFDFIYCQEVLHHLPEPREAFLRLTGLLRPGGVIAIYVYGEKGAIREFADDHIREVLSSLSDYDRERVLDGITALGKQLSEIEGEISVSGLESIGLRSGRVGVQKFFYDNFLKCFWNEHLGFDSSKGINFDWYAPSLATKHTETEVSGWFVDAGLDIIHANNDEYGITIHGQKK